MVSYRRVSAVLLVEWILLWFETAGYEWLVSLCSAASTVFYGSTHLTQRNGCGPGSGLVLRSLHQSQVFPADYSFREGALSGQMWFEGSELGPERLLD